MKKYLILVMFSFIAIGCNDDFLDNEPLDQIGSSSVFEDEDFTLSYLYKIYSFLPQGYGDVSTGYGWRFMLASITDEARSKSAWIDSNRHWIPGATSPTNNVLGNWSSLYSGIRRANNMITSLETSTLDDDFKTRVTAEARYLRAWFYFDLTRRYGNVPLILVAQDQTDDLLVSQTSRSEIYTFIDEELDAIESIIPLRKDVNSAQERGRINRETVWSLSSRINLFAEKYVKSALSSSKVMNGGFVLNNDFDALFQSDFGDSEVIFEIENTLPFKGHSFDALNLPFSLKAFWGAQTNPTQELVNAYEMAVTGLAITDPLSGYDASHPYSGRDLRFYATIAFHGSFLKGKTLDLLYPDGEDAPLKSGLHTESGYYLKKFIDESLPFGPNLKESKISWKEFRLGEILLNFAEAQNESSGPDASVYNAINQLRTRAGLPNLPGGLSKSDMRDRIRHERRVELAFENHRFFDLIRWGTAQEVLHGNKFHGMFVKDDDNDGVLEYETFEINRPAHVFLPKNYLFPISQGEIEKNPNLVQNPGY